MSKLLVSSSKEAHDLNVLSEPKTLIFHTGNIANWNSLKSRKAQVPLTELYQSLQATLKGWLSGSNSSEQNDVSKKPTGSFNSEDERQLVKITVKVMLHKFDETHIREAVKFALEQLKVSYFDTIMLALPPVEEDSSFEDVLPPYWKEMEKLHNEGSTKSISSCDLDRNKLETLMQIANIPPEVNQVNLTSCCHMPQDLVAYAKETNVTLYTHGDHEVMLSEEKVDSLIKSVHADNPLSWSTNWVLRYAVVIKCRGVIHSKGYIASIMSQKESLV